MPTMSAKSVKVLPMISRLDMALEQVRDAMTAQPPSLEDLSGGWASMANARTNLGTVGLAPPASAPVIDEATDVLPRRLSARFYYWDAPPAGARSALGYDPYATRKLAAVDVLVTKPDDRHIGMLWSTRSRLVLNRREGAVASLQRILQSQDASVRIDRSSSHLQLQDTDVFLWLTVQCRDRPQIAQDIRLDKVSGISGRDASSRTADLRAGVDFERPNFLTAVAEADTLGPIEIDLVQLVGEGRRSFHTKVHIDGGFEIGKNDVHLPDVVDSEELMLSATSLLAFSLIPRINDLYVADAANWSSRRLEVIRQAMDDLERRYRRAREVLEERKTSSPAG